MIFCNNSKFKIWAYSVIHSISILRSEKQYHDVYYETKYSPNNTIDIEFSSVEFISMPDNLNGIKIIKEIGKYYFNDNKEHFIIANSCCIGISQFDFTQDRISNSSLKYEEIIMKI